MNFYRMFVGDYMADTGQLTLAEHGAYMLMLHTFYHTEKPLPEGMKLYRLLRCETKAERDAVDSVVGQYWIPTPEGLVNRKAVEELARAQQLAERNRLNGKTGGRPRTQDKPSGKPRKNPLGFDSVNSGKPTAQVVGFDLVKQHQNQITTLGQGDDSLGEASQ
jgi:uncharacterized protein YdaU (DUF1376 family)